MRDPSGCGRCGASQRTHYLRAYHQWADPTWEQRRAAILANAAESRAIRERLAGRWPQAPVAAILRPLHAAGWRLTRTRVNESPGRRYWRCVSASSPWYVHIQHHEAGWSATIRGRHSVYLRRPTLREFTEALRLCGWEVPDA